MLTNSSKGVQFQILANVEPQFTNVGEIIICYLKQHNVKSRQRNINAAMILTELHFTLNKIRQEIIS